MSIHDMAMLMSTMPIHSRLHVLSTMISEDGVKKPTNVYKLLRIKKKKKPQGLGMVVHVFIPSTSEAEAGGSL